MGCLSLFAALPALAAKFFGFETLPAEIDVEGATDEVTGVMESASAVSDDAADAADSGVGAPVSAGMDSLRRNPSGFTEMEMMKY